MYTIYKSSVYIYAIIIICMHDANARGRRRSRRPPRRLTVRINISNVSYYQY